MAPKMNCPAESNAISIVINPSSRTTPCSQASMVADDAAARSLPLRSSSDRRYHRMFLHLTGKLGLTVASSSRLAPELEPSPPLRKPAPAMRNKHLANVMPMDPIVETPVKDLRIISAMLKQPDPATPLQVNGRQQPQHPTPSSLPPLPPSPSDGTGPSISAMVLSKPRDIVKKMLQADVKPPNESVKAFRGVSVASSLDSSFLTHLSSSCQTRATYGPSPR